MIKFNFNSTAFIISMFLVFSCNISNEKLAIVEIIRDSIKNIHTPDKRVAMFNIEISSKGKSLVLKGESDQSKAIEDFKAVLIKNGIQFIDSIDLLPNKSVGELEYAVINNSVGNIRSNPKHSGELATQALLGTGVKVLKKMGSFYLIQVPDRYISWIDHGGVSLMNEQEYNAWMGAEKIVYTNTVGNVYSSNNDKSELVSDIVLGCQLIVLNIGKNFYHVEYPDQRTGYIKINEASIYKDWILEVNPTGNRIEKYSRDLLGSPYLWGGTSSKGMDCSGFTKTVYLMNGFIIPRDASQQITAGEIVDKDLVFDGLQKGDLMFFGKAATESSRQRVTHVGIWLGNDKGEFIHASKQVRLSSINPKSDYYDEGNTKRYLGSRRYLGIKDQRIIDLKTDHLLSDIKQ